MKKVVITAVITASFVFAPVSVFATKNFNSSKSNSSSISKVTTQADCKKVSGVWVAGAELGTGVCQPSATQSDPLKGPKKFNNKPLD